MQEKIVDIEGEIHYGRFIDRPNRFLVNLKLNDSNEICAAHLHDPGRMKELLLPNVLLAVRQAINKNGRKTKWDILAVQQYNKWIVINSGIPNIIAKKAFENKWIEPLAQYNLIKPEIRIGDSRLDFYLSNQNEKCYVEVKGVTLVKGKKAFFPDAPTSRGARHLRELIKLSNNGNKTVVLFFVMRDDPIVFSPNWKTDPDFSKQLLVAIDEGVEILVYTIYPQIINNKLKLQLKNKINIELIDEIK